MLCEPSVFRINQEGYAPGLPVTVAVLGNGPVLLKNAAGEIVRSFSFGAPQTDPASGDAVTLVSLGILPEGTYELVSGPCRRRNPSLYFH